MSKDEAHKLLDEVRAGIQHPPSRINQALIATGDLRRWMPAYPHDYAHQAEA